MKELLHNIKLMLNPVIILVTIVMVFFMSMILGFWWGIPFGILSTYHLLFKDKSHKWNGVEWVNETKQESKQDGNTK